MKHTLTCLAPFSLMATAMALPTGESNPADLQAALAPFEALYDEVLPWVAELYDPVSGGFYESVGLKRDLEPVAYGPDIQSTHMAFSMIRQSDAKFTMPEAFKEKLIRYFQERQDPDTGYFVDPDYPQMWENQRVLGRALSFSVGSLKALDAEPLYSLPGQDKVKPAPKAPAPAGTPAPAPAKKAAGLADSAAAQSKAAPPSKLASAATPSAPAANVYVVPGIGDLDLSHVPPHLVSPEAFRQWMDERPWQHAWTAVDNIQSQASLINNLPEPLRTAIINEVIRYITLRQEPDTGLVGGGNIEVRLSGAFKLILFCRAVQRPVPAADKLQATVVEWFQGESTTEKIFYIRNACDMLEMLITQTRQDLTEEQLVAIIRFATRELDRFRQADGAFSSYADVFYVCPNDLYYGENIVLSQVGPQSNINATRMAMATREAVYRLLGEPRPLLKAGNFWEACLDDTPRDTAVNKEIP